MKNIFFSSIRLFLALTALAGVLVPGVCHTGFNDPVSARGQGKPGVS